MSRAIRSVVFVSLAILSLNCKSGGTDSGGSAGTPTTPTPVATPTRIINLTGNLAFGDVTVGTSRELTFTIGNGGNATLTVTSLSISGGLSTQTTASFTSGTIVAGGSQSVTIRFTPTTATAFSGTITVNGDQTSGSNTIGITGTGLISFAGTWSGGHVIRECNGTGSVQDLICGAARGAFRIGTNLTFGATLTQSGTTVTGTVNLGGLIGPVTGVVSGGTLVLSGGATGSGFTAVISGWSTQVSGNTMTGAVNYTLTFQGVPGNAGIVSTLQSVTR
jgi:hypothetical protein